MTNEPRSTTTAAYQAARTESDRCLQCFDAPCIQACPTHIRIPVFIAMIASGNVRGAAEVVKTSNPLANTCGKICPEEIYCQSVCSRGKLDLPVAIRELHLFATRSEARAGFSPLAPPPRPQETGGPKRVAVLGGGPAGLSCAFTLSRFGHRVTLFDKKGPGGVPRKSIPAFRLGERELRDDLEFLSGSFMLQRKDIGGADFDGIRKKFDAVYIGIGLGKDRPLGVKGERLKGVLPVLRFLEAAKRKPVAVGRRVVVIGGGNVSLDAAASARRLGAAEVTLLYRRGEREMKVWKSELEEARKQGVDIRFLTAPREIVGRTAVTGIRCYRTALGKSTDRSGRRVPVEVEGSDFLLETDMVIVAVGQVIGSDLVEQLPLNGKGFIAVDRDFRTPVPGVFAGGDAISGEGTIVQAVAHGKQAARSIHEFLRKPTR